MAKNLFHDVVKEALLIEGWQITHDPLPVAYGDVQMQIDLGAERLLAAERGTEKIAVEVKSFTQILHHLWEVPPNPPTLGGF